MNKYKVLDKQVYTLGKYSIVPIRIKDRYDIMRWRNEQMYHLRQNKHLTPEEQDRYFDTVVSILFDQEKPDQVLFSYLEGEKCIGYGGLVHINWIDRNAEISFIMNTKLETEKFGFHWSNFLAFIEEVAFANLGLHKIFVFAFDLRPHLYNVLTQNNYFMDARLNQHFLFNENFIDVVIHSKLNNEA